MTSRYRLRSYLAGATAARTADEMSAPALLLLGLAVTGSARSAALLYAGLTISAAAGGLVLGALLDRSDRPGRLLGWALTGYAAGLAVIAVSLGRLPLGAVAGVAVLAGSLAPSLTGGWTSRLPNVLASDRLSRGYALDAATYSAAALAGPALAGLVAAAAGPGWAMAAVTILLLLAAPAAWRLPARPARATLRARPALRADLRAGLTAIISARPLLRITLCSVVAYLGVPMLVVACPLLGQRYLGGAARGALLLSVLAAASLAATAALARWPPRLPPDITFVAATALAGCAYLALALAPRTAWVIAAVAVAGVADGPQLAAIFAIRHRETPRRLRGQVFTTAASLKITAGAIGAAVAGRLAGHSAALVLTVAAGTQGAALLAFALASVPRRPCARPPLAGPATAGRG
ncbi:MAG TPA: MFS transporter [Streptosporangiaceae bacterium]